MTTLPATSVISMYLLGFGSGFLLIGLLSPTIPGLTIAWGTELSILVFAFGVMLMSIVILSMSSDRR